MTKFCSIGYIPAPTFLGATEFYANITAWRHRHPLILFSEHKWDDETILLKASPEILVGERRHARSNLVWLTALRILRTMDYTHFCYLEQDVRVASHEWDGKIFDEAFSDGVPFLAGSVVCHSMCSVSLKWTKLWAAWLAQYAFSPFPPVCLGGAGIAEKSVPCMFLNGALGVYDLKLMLDYFAPQLVDGQTAAAAIELPAWDVHIGRILHERHGEGIFSGIVKHLSSVYSSYGDVQTSEAERLEMLVTLQAVAVHQVKGKVTGPLSEADLDTTALFEEFSAQSGAQKGKEEHHEKGVVTEPGGANSEENTRTSCIECELLGEKKCPDHAERIPSMDIFVVTFAKDAEWLLYCLRSIRKFCTGFNSVVILVPMADKDAFAAHRKEFKKGFKWKFYAEKPATLGFLDHMVQVCRAEKWCEGDLICHVDSDCVFFRPVTPQDYLVDGKPVLLIEPFEVLNKTHAGRANWKTGIDLALGCYSTHETMCRHPAVHWRGIYDIMRNHIAKVHGKTFEEYVFSCQPTFPQGFSEFNSLGNYAMLSLSLSPGYHFVDLSKEPRPQNHLAQGHSHPKGDPNSLDNLHHYLPDFSEEVNSHRKLVEKVGLL